MTKRKFELPGIQDLSKEQEEARSLPKHGQHLIIGGPGTGKSVLAILRAKRLHNAKDDYTFLVYNHLLDQASKQLFYSRGSEQMKSVTWHKWFAINFAKITGSEVPKKPPQNGSNWQEIDWDGVNKCISEIQHDVKIRKEMLVIDEGQDMPPEFYQTLANLGFENFYVVADYNQRIVEGQHSSRPEHLDVLCKNPDEAIELIINYRNSFPTARLARHFYTDPSSPPPDLPSEKRRGKAPILIEYDGKNQPSFETIIGRIIKTADIDPRKLIGVITPNNDVREKYLRALGIVSRQMKLDNGIPHFQTFAFGQSAKLSFDIGGIMVINAQSCKGLEFDTVVIADIDQHRCPYDATDDKKRLFYVMVARAKNNVVFLKNGTKNCAIEHILPKNENLLQWVK